LRNLDEKAKVRKMKVEPESERHELTRSVTSTA
jgi:hypothetical protein